MFALNLAWKIVNAYIDKINKVYYKLQFPPHENVSNPNFWFF